MKNLLTVLIVLILFTLDGIAQITPTGMKYQAVARDLDGQILADKAISLKIALFTEGNAKTYQYTEGHDAITNKLGLFTLTIGEGKHIQGAFDQIPWSTDQVWMELSIDDQGGDNFKLVHSSKLLAVPYAYHAGTANKLVQAGGVVNPNGTIDIKTGVPSQTWSLFGNSTTDPTVDKLGTTDLADLVIVTDNIERMRILEDGDVEIVNSLNIGNDLTVEDNVYLNTVSGETINNGPFTVANQSPTLLSGTLTVDEETDLNSSLNVDGVTNLNSDLYVNNQSPTLLSGTLTVDLETDLNSSLNVDGITDLNSDLNVNNMSPTTLTGTLLVEKDATFKEHVTLDNANHGSTNSTDGALVVAGGAGIGENLNVAGDLNIEGPSINLNAPPASLPIPKFYVHFDEAKFGVPVKFSAKTTFEAPVEINNATTPITETALIVKANVAAGTNNETPTHHVATFENLADGNGISIKVNNSNPQNKNNFITFYGTGTATSTPSGEPATDRPIRGRIEGEWTAADLLNNLEYQDDLRWNKTDTELALGAEIIAGLEVIQAGLKLFASTTSSTFCAGVGACVTTPIPSFIVSAGADFVLQTANFGVAAADAIIVAQVETDFINRHRELLGITVASGSEDYAEYLPKLNPEEKFSYGDIVGVENGFITKNTRDASKIMVISLKPIIAGGLPPDADVSDYELVAFMGQVPTKVVGKVNPGDHILPSGYNNGFGIAKSPEFMRPQDFKKSLGVAWEGSREGEDYGYVNTAIGLNSNALADVVQEQEAKIHELEEKMERNNSILAELVPGYAEALNMEQSHPIDHDHDHAVEEHLPNTTNNVKDLFVESTVDQIIYFPIESEHLEESFRVAEEIAKKEYEKRGIDINIHPFWNRIYTDPSYKEEVMHNMATELKYSMHTHESINENMLEEKK